jgi:hypothetical protein
MSSRSTVPATALPSRRSLRSRRRRRSTLVTGLAVGPLLLVGVSAAFAYPHLGGSWTGARHHRATASSIPSFPATIPATTVRPVTSYADTIHPTVGDATSTSVSTTPSTSRSAATRAAGPLTPGAFVDEPFDPATAPAGRYVDCTAGDDAAAGTARQPWRSLNPLSRPVPAGTAVHLKRGCSWDGGLTLAASGSGAATLGAYASGKAPVISGTGLSRGRGVLQLVSPRTTVTGIHLTHAPGFGVNVTGDHATLEGVEIDDVGVGMQISAPFATVTGSAIHDLHMYNNTPGGDDDSGAIGFGVSADDVTIATTSCTNCRAPSYDYGYDGGFVDIWRQGNRLKLVDNVATNVQGFLEVGGMGGNDSAYDIVVTGNKVTRTYGGIWVHGDGTFSIRTGNIKVSGNTFVLADGTPVFGGTTSALVLGSNTTSRG